MSWADLAGSAPPELSDSPFEAARFGVSVQRLALRLGAEQGIDAVVEVAASASADVVVLRYPEVLARMPAALRASGRDFVLADTLTYWRLRVGHGVRPATRAGLEVAARTLDPVTVDELVADVFDGYTNHYAANPLFDPAAALAGYQEWARRSVLATTPVVATDEGGPVALATTVTGPGHLEIELAGVRRAQQGKGVYAHLLAGVEDVAADNGLADVVISTQGHNVNVQRAWARYGFEPVASFVTAHLVRRGLLDG